MQKEGKTMTVLKGVKVLDLTHYIAGPYCSQILADYGADVIKIEQLNGEVGRTSAPLQGDVSLYFASENRNKRGMALNLKSEEGKRILEELIKVSDVLVTNYGTKIPEKLGFDYDSISAINPAISMVHITGFGTNGPYKDYGAYDGVIQSMGGLAELTGHPGGQPTYVGFFIADHIAGLQAAVGTMMALFHKERTGEGRYVDISMLDSFVSLLGFSLAEADLHGVKQQRWGMSDRFKYSKAFPAKNGYVFLGAYINAPEKKWVALANLIGREEWMQENSVFYTEKGRFENREVVDKAISEWTEGYTKDEAFQLLQEHGIASSPVNNLEEVSQDQQIKERDMIKKLNISNIEVPVAGAAIKILENPVEEFTPPPALGEHSIEILKELGFKRNEIDQFISNNVVKAVETGSGTPF